MLNNIKYLVIGNGRLARHLKFYFDNLGIKYSSWQRATNTAQELLEWANQATRILLAISDSAIETVILSYPQIPQNKWVHLSGALSIPGIYSAHPLGSFGEKLNPAEWYPEIYFIIEQQKGMPNITLSELLPGLPNPSAQIISQDKPYYHSLCVLSNNFSTILFQKLFLGLEQELDIPRKAAYRYLKQTVFNLENNPNPLTGPLARQDFGTIQKNIQALQQRDDNYADIYQAFVKLMLPKSSTLNLK
jgi:predicted short-subunit dehydrogenase-like oxidoreductase (DUF2520 family)